jgi:O-antigen ligase
MTRSVDTARHLGPDAVLAAYAIVLVVIPSAYTLGSYAMTAGAVLGVVAATLWFSAVLVARPGDALGRNPARRAILTYLGLMVVSYLVAMLRPLDDLDAGSADRSLVGLISVAGAGLLAADHLRDRDSLYRVLGALVAGGGVIAAIGILQFTVGFDLASRLRPPGFRVDSSSGFLFRRAGFDRVAGTAGHPIEFGIVCTLILPIALHLAWSAPRAGTRRMAIVSAALLGLALPMALSRVAVAAVLVALVALLPGLPPGRRWKVIGAIAALAWGITLLAPGILTTVGELFTGDTAEGSNAARTRSTETYLDLFAERPIIGHGFGTLHGVIVDNQYLVTLVQSGVLGIGALLLLVNGPILCLRDARRTTSDDGLRELSLALIAVILAFLVASLGLATLVYAMSSGVLFLAIGLVGALARIAATEHDVAIEAADRRVATLRA